MEKKIKILHNRILITALSLMGAVTIFIIIGLLVERHDEVIQGQAENEDYRVSSKVPGRVLEIRVKEGQRVSRGDTLAILDIPDIAARHTQAVAAVMGAKALETKTRNGDREEQIRSAYELWQKSIAARQVAEKTFRRMSHLHAEGVISDQKYDETLAALDAAIAAERAAKSQHDMAVNGARIEDRQAADAQTRRAKGVVSELRTYLSEAVLLAADDGRVSEIFPEVGELIGTGAPIMNVVTDDVVFKFNVREDMLPGIETGKVVTVTLPALNQTIKAKVSLIKNVGNFATWKATSSLGGFDLKMFEVQVRPIKKLQHIREGMTAVIIKE